MKASAQLKLRESGAAKTTADDETISKQQTCNKKITALAYYRKPIGIVSL